MAVWKVAAVLFAVALPFCAQSSPITITQTFLVDASSVLSIDGNGDPFYLAYGGSQPGIAVDPSLGDLLKIAITNSYSISRSTADGTATLRIRMYYADASSIRDGSFGNDITIGSGIFEYTHSNSYEIQSGYNGPHTKWDFWLNAPSITYYSDAYSHTSQPRFSGSTTLKYFYDTPAVLVPEPGTGALALMAAVSAHFGIRRGRREQKIAAQCDWEAQRSS